MKKGIRVIGICLLIVVAVACATKDSDNTTSSTSPISTTVSTASTTSVPVPATSPTTTGTSAPSTTLTTVRPTSTTSASQPARVVRRADTAESVVALTFDAGSDRGYAEEILDLLNAEGIQASFGLTGRWAEANPDLVRRMSEDGHTLINHTYDHPHLETLTTAERLSQLDRTESIVERLSGASTRPYFRPPYGSYDEQVLIDAGSAGYRLAIMWTVDSLGWKGIPADEVVARCLVGAQPGAIFLLHVGAESTDFDALPELITQLREAGYRFATIAQLVL